MTWRHERCAQKDWPGHGGLCHGLREECVEEHEQRLRLLEKNEMTTDMDQWVVQNTPSNDDPTLLPT